MARDFIHDNLEEFKRQFPNLCLDEPIIANLRIPVGTLRLTPMRFIARNVKDGFRKRVYKDLPRAVSTL